MCLLLPAALAAFSARLRRSTYLISSIRSESVSRAKDSSVPSQTRRSAGFFSCSSTFASSCRITFWISLSPFSGKAERATGISASILWTIESRCSPAAPTTNAMFRSAHCCSLEETGMTPIHHQSIGDREFQVMISSVEEIVGILSSLSASPPRYAKSMQGS